MNVAPVLRMEDLLGGLGSEQEREKRELGVDNSPLREILHVFEDLLKKKVGGFYEDHCACMRMIPSCYTARDIEAFNAIFINYESAPPFNYYAGLPSVMLLQSYPFTVPYDLNSFMINITTFNI